MRRHPMAEVREYRLKVHKEEDHLWAEIVELPGCFATGRDMDELAEALGEAISIYLAPTPEERPEVRVHIQPRHDVTKMPARVELVPA